MIKSMVFFAICQLFSRNPIFLGTPTHTFISTLPTYLPLSLSLPFQSFLSCSNSNLLPHHCSRISSCRIKAFGFLCLFAASLSLYLSSSLCSILKINRIFLQASLSFSWPLPPSLSLSFKKSIFELYLLTHTYLLPLTIFLLQQVLFLKNRPTPASSFLFIFVLFKHKFTEKNCRRKKVSNSDRRSRRRAC